jgi:hypothetical protein
MRVPEDITLLWSDDNHGNLRRVPTEDERGRSGGAGIYYHLDYVGGPRSYKWVNTVPLQKIWEQMHKAYEYGADRIWILNVGDLKPMEFQTEYFLRMAWNIKDFTKDNAWEYSVMWAEREFGKEFAEDIAYIINRYSKFNGRLKPELLNKVELYSLIDYKEAETVIADFNEIIDIAEKIYKKLPDNLKDAFLQLPQDHIDPMVLTNLIIALTSLMREMEATDVLAIAQKRNNITNITVIYKTYIKVNRNLNTYCLRYTIGAF